MIISSLLLAASKGDAFDFSSERQLWVAASAAADALPECVRQCECAADLLPGNRNSHLNPSIDSRDSTYKSCYIQKAFAQNAMASNDPGCRVADCDARWQQLVPVLAAMTCASDNEEGAWARSDPWRRSRALTTPTAMPPRRLIDQVARGLAAQCTLRPTKMPTRMPTKAPTKSPTVKNNFIEPCLVNPADPCPCPERGMRSATCMQAKGFAQAALRENDGSCTRTCSQEVVGILKATANRQCIQDGGAWDESDSVTAKVWGRNLRSKLDPRRLQQEDICAVEATPAPTPLPSKSPTPSPTKAPIPEGCKTGSTGGANGINRACTLPFTYKGVKYETCTDVDSSAGLWCSTKTDWWGNHVPGEGNYGDCVETPTCDLPCKTTGDSPRRPRQQCVFPFVFDGKTYTSCAPEEGRPGGWCSTQTDLFDQHISGNWGYCNPEGCPAVVPVAAPAPAPATPAPTPIPAPAPGPAPGPSVSGASWTGLGKGYCEDDTGGVMANYQKYTGESLDACRGYCDQMAGCVGVSYAAAHSNGQGLCQLHGATQGPDASWVAHAAGSPSTQITRSQGSWTHYACYVKVQATPAPAPAPAPPTPFPTPARPSTVAPKAWSEILTDAGACRKGMTSGAEKQSGWIPGFGAGGGATEEQCGNACLRDPNCVYFFWGYNTYFKRTECGGFTDCEEWDTEGNFGAGDPNVYQIRGRTAAAVPAPVSSWALVLRDAGACKKGMSSVGNSGWIQGFGAGGGATEEQCGNACVADPNCVYFFWGYNTYFKRTECGGYASCEEWDTEGNFGAGDPNVYQIVGRSTPSTT